MDILNKSASSLVPTDTTQWGNTIHTEAVQRLPKIEPFIESFRLVYANQDGDGLGLLILNGGKSFVPAIVKEWRTLPMDVLIYKKGKDTKYGYLAERNLLKLMMTSSLGTPTGLPRQGLNNGYINLFSPAGGYGARTSNPWLNQSKAASEWADYLFEALPEGTDQLYRPSLEKSAYAKEVLDNYQYWRSSTDLSNAINPPSPEIINRYAVLYKTANDGCYEMYTYSNEDPIPLHQEQVSRMFDLVPHDQRIEKVASFELNRVVVVGNVLRREGNYFVEPTNSAGVAQTPERALPAKEGTFLYNGVMTYINPKLIYADGTNSSYALGVQVGKYTVSKNFFGFAATNTPDSSQQSRDTLLSRCAAPSSGDTIVIHNVLDGSMTVPIKVVRTFGDMGGVTGFMGIPQYGDPTPTEFRMYTGSKILSPQAGVLLYPSATTSFYTLPEKCEDLGVSTPIEESIRIIITKGGGNTYSIKEDNTYLTSAFNTGRLVSTLIRRYGLDGNQAINIVETLNRDRQITIRVPHLMHEVTPTAVPTRMELPSREKEALSNVIKTANGLASIASINVVDGASITKHANEIDMMFDRLFSKLAAEDPNAAPASPPPGTTTSGVPAPSAPMMNQQNILSYLSNISPVTRDTQEIVDQLTYYAVGRFRPEEGITLITEIEDYLLDTENALAKLLLLTQLGRIPGMDYSDTKVLLSDIDSYLSRILSSRVLLKDI